MKKMRQYRKGIQKMKSIQDLKQQIKKIDGKSYGMYKTIKGMYKEKNYIIAIDHVQGDPFATPSRIRLIIPKETHGFPVKLHQEKVTKLALEDYILRIINQKLYEVSKRAGSGNSGKIQSCSCGQEILERIAVVFEKNEDLTIRLIVGLPARGRTILGREFEKIINNTIPELVNEALIYQHLDKNKIEKSVHLAIDQKIMREMIKAREYVAFIANGSILPRANGISQKPLKDAIPFTSPKTMEIELELPYYGKIKGMGIKKGVSLIVGGGYHGKSTLLQAIQLGVYNHIAGDGREYVVTDHTALKIRAEDGRCIKNCDISLFINHLPNGKNTTNFSTDNASGSTSQAANIIEGIAGGSKTFLIDEDTSATNFMIRDNLMSKLIKEEEEPITPFIQRVREIYEKLGISTIIVVGSSGTYLSKADTIIQMKAYQAYDITEKAKVISKELAENVENKVIVHKPKTEHYIKSSDLKKTEKGIKIKTIGTDSLIINKETIDVRYQEQIISNEQLIGIGYFVKKLLENNNQTTELYGELRKLYNKIENEGMMAIVQEGYSIGTPALPRIHEVLQTVYRYRGC